MGPVEHVRAGIFECPWDHCAVGRFTPSGECPQYGELYHRYYEVKEYGSWLRMFVHAEVAEQFELPEGALTETNKRENNAALDTTTFLATEGRRLEQPFHQSELRRLSTGESIAEDYSWQPAYVVQRPDDFPDFP